MDSDDAIVGRILSRREAIEAAARAGAALGAAGFGIDWLLGCAAEQTHQGLGPTVAKGLPLIASPALTEGPFYVDERLNRSDLLAGTKRPSVVNGTPLAVAFAVHNLEGDKLSPMTGAIVDVWHADALGVYSDEADRMNHEVTTGQNWLRGYQSTDADGRAAFQTILPGWYRGRTPHIHFKVRRAGEGRSAEFTSQLFFHEQDITGVYAKQPYASVRGRDTDNTNDDIFNERLEDGSVAGSHLLLDLSKQGNAFASTFAVVLTEDSMRTRGRRGPGGPPPGGPRGRPGGPPPRRPRPI